jgi:L-lysine 6-transaminase
MEDVKMKTVFDIKIDFKKSAGSYLYDKNTKSYFLDFFGMFSSLPLGYNHPIFDSSFEEKIMHISKIRMANNLFASDELNEFIQEFRKKTFSEFHHYTCTGALAVESALKSAMEYKKIKDPMVFGLKKGFHGINSWGFITDRYLSTAERIKYYPQNNWRNLELEQIISFLKTEDTSNIVAVIIEPIQCTAGDIYLSTSKLVELQHLCNKQDICFIVDEIQTGFGVTGNMWYSNHIGIEPDVLVFGKKAQICGIVTNGKYSEAITSSYRKLEVTFDGELMDAIRAEYILKAFDKHDILKNVTSNSLIFSNLLEKRVKNYRGIGNMIAFDFNSNEERNEFVDRCYSKQLLCNPTGEKSVRMRPNLAVSNLEIERFSHIIDSVL